MHAQKDDITRGIVEAFEKVFLKWHGFLIGSYIKDGDFIINVKFYPRDITYVYTIDSDRYDLFMPGSFNATMAPQTVLKYFKKQKVPLLYLVK